MRILVIGSCRDDDQEHNVPKHQKLAEELGMELAKRGHILITGGAGGLQGIVADSYKKNGGKSWEVCWAKNEENDKGASPPSGIKPDKETKTDMAYPVRNAHYIGQCDAVIALSGLLATLNEIIHAVVGYKIKVLQLDMGENVRIIRSIPLLKEKVIISSDVGKGLNFLGYDRTF